MSYPVCFSLRSGDCNGNFRRWTRIETTRRETSANGIHLDMMRDGDGGGGVEGEIGNIE